MKFFMAQNKKMCWFGYALALILALVLVACGGNSGGNETTYLVVYDGNGADDGSVPVDADHYEAGQTVTVLGNTGDLVRDGYSYAGWNTEADGSGTTYTEEQTFKIGAADATLYARWSANVAYIYGDNTAAENFKTLLDPTYPTDLILKTNIGSTDFTNIP